MRRLAGVVAVVAATSVVLAVAQPAVATYPGKNGLVAFSLDTGNGFQINTIRPNGEGIQQITSVTGSALAADWSPDGTKIVFDIDPNGGEEGCGIFVMDADGSNIVDLTPKGLVGKGACAYNPSFTPNGKRIVYMAQACPSCWLGIASMNLQGGDRHRIAKDPCDCVLHSPKVSPDGRTILFLVEKDVHVNGVEGNRKSLYTVRMNGTHMRRIVPFRFDVCVCVGDWAPNGRRIVSSSQAGPTPVPGVPSNLFTVRPDGTGLHYLTHSRNTDVIIGVGSYSPNGHWIMYKRITAKGAYRLMKIHPSGRAATIITPLPANFIFRDWGPQPK